MTLCIAAACRYLDGPALALCSDTRSLSSSQGWGLTISSENADKSREIGDFAALIAGDPTKADELLAHCDAAVMKFAARSPGPDTDLYFNEFFEELRSASRGRMKQIQDHFIAMNSPFKGCDDFLSRAKSSLPDSQYRELWEEMHSQHLGAEVIVGGFHDEAVIVKIDTRGNPHWEDQYAVIGTGSTDALSFLAQNEFDESEIKLEDCLLRVMEAMMFASTANNTVGPSMRFEVRTKDKGTFDLKKEFFELLATKVRLRSLVSLGDCGDFLESSDDEIPSEELHCD